jgi:hypothetical protein
MHRAAPAASVPPTSGPGLEGDIERAVAFAGPYIEGLLAKSVPTVVVLRTLAAELTRASTRTKNVAHPELLDADLYWEKSAWPQAAAVVKHARRALVELAQELESSVRGKEQMLDGWLTVQVEAEAMARAEDPDAVRDRTIDGIAVQCTAIHRTIEGLAAIRPDRMSIIAARREIDEARHRRAVEDVKSSRDEVASAHPELDRDAFKQMWLDTLDARVAERDHFLLGETPHRHQDLLVRAFEAAIDAIDVDITAMITQLTEPILGIGERVVRRYDDAVATADAGGMRRDPR